MRGLGQDMTIGERVAWYRTRRGLTQEVLAGMVGRTDDWLSKIENGRANLERLSVIKALADALDVTVGDLLGEPAILDWNASGATTPSVGLLRDALMDYSALVPMLSSATPEPLGDLRSGVDDVWNAYQASRFGYTTVRLPRLISGARAASKSMQGPERREALRLLALSYHAAAATLTKLGEPDLAWIASDRGLASAEDSENPQAVASLLRSVAHALLSIGRYSSAADVVTRSTDRLSSRTEPDPTHWSLLGSLFLVGAMAAARADDPREARTFLSRARQASQQLGHDANHAWTAFGPTNVAVHDVSVAMELGDLQTAASLASRVDARPLPVERRVRHALEVAKVYTMTNREADALQVLLHAERDAPEQVRHHYIARELVLTCLRRGRTIRPELDALAARLQVA